MLKKTAQGEMLDLVDAVEAHRIFTYEELVAEIRLKLANSNGQLTKFEAILSDIKHSCDAYKAAELASTNTQNNTSLEAKERDRLVGGIKSKLGFIDNFFIRYTKDLRQHLEFNQIEGAADLAFLIVNGYRESVGAPPLDKQRMRTL